MTLHSTPVLGLTGEDADDLRAYLQSLGGERPVTHTVLAACDAEVHGADRATWFYVEADSGAGVARRRCIGCANVQPLLDSDERWTHPPMYACGGCGQSIVEVAVGLSAGADGDPDAGRVHRLTLGVRCVGCGHIESLVEMPIASLTVGEVAELI